MTSALCARSCRAALIAAAVPSISGPSKVTVQLAQTTNFAALELVMRPLPSRRRVCDSVMSPGLPPASPMS